MTLSEALTSRANDYSELEQRYKEVTGGELVCEPFGSSARGRERITRTASVIIAAWNAQHTIRQCLKAIELSSFNRRYGSQLEVVVIDDGSTDATWESLKNARLKLNLKLLRQQNMGQYRAINAALAVAEGDIIVSCDDDMILTHFAIEELMKRHEALERVLLIGFRYDISRDDPRISLEALAWELPSFLPAFEGDNRLTFHWPGWPENMCAETGHLKRLNGSQRIFVNDGETLDGDYWDLPRMVYGALFSLPRADYLFIGGYDEKIAGWGFGDTLLGAKAYALGNYIVPVYSAVGLHVAHADRSLTKWEEAKRNLARIERLRRRPLTNGSIPPDAMQRIVEQVYHSSGPPQRSLEAAAFATLSQHLTDGAARGRYLLTLGRYAEAVEAFGRAPESAEVLSGMGKALYRLGQFAQAAGHFRAWMRRDTGAGDAYAWLAVALAAAGDFHGGQKVLQRARPRRKGDGLLLHLTRNTAEAFSARARKHVQQKFFGWAVRDLEAALLHEPDNAAFARRRATALAEM